MPSDLRQCDQRGGQGLDCVINLVLWWVDSTIKGGPEGKTVLLKRALEPKTVFHKARSRARLCLWFWPSNQRPYYRKVPSNQRQCDQKGTSISRLYYQTRSSSLRLYFIRSDQELDCTIREVPRAQDSIIWECLQTRDRTVKEVLRSETVLHI
jgi:hypothetical protein